MVSSTSSIKAIAAFFSLMTLTNAHMIMKTPIPYGKGTINSSPLADDGSDYPCKNLFEMDDPTNDVNYLTPGVPATLSFTGSAVHGGGSCQVALTTDLKPSKSSKWMVIKSIEGGCPANIDGNFPADPSGSSATKFQYTVPEGFTEGDYTIAWTWFNKIGNREMYMNCGRAHIGAQKKRYAATPKPKVEVRAANFPDILKAQLQIFSDCKIPEGTNVAYPNPGPDVQVVAAATTLCGGAGGAATPNSGGGASSVVATSAAATSAAATSAAAATTSAAGFGGSPVSSAASQPTGNPGVFASGAASQSAAAPTEATAATSAAVTTATVEPIPVAQSSVAPVPSAVPSSGSTTGNGSNTPSTGSNVAGSPCSQEGAWACSSDGKSFQRCASGVWSAPMAVAAGTSCTPGTSMNLNMGAGKRDLLSHIHGFSSHHRRAVHLAS